MVLLDPIRRSLLACLALFLFEAFPLFGAFPARAASTAWIGDDRAAVRLVTATDAASPGSSVEASLEFRFGDGWHGAWRSPGDAGLAPTLDGSGSEGVVLDTIAWPAPRRLAVGELQTFVYESGVVLPLRFARRGDGAAHLHLRLVHAVCGEVCVPYRATLDLALPAGTDRPSAEAGLIRAARGRVPGPPEAAGFAIVGQAREGPPDDWRLGPAGDQQTPRLRRAGPVRRGAGGRRDRLPRDRPVRRRPRGPARPEAAAGRRGDRSARHPGRWPAQRRIHGSAHGWHRFGGEADPAILAFLRRFGRFGIPLVAVYGPGLPRGEALPELLTPATMRAAIVRAERENANKITTEFSP